MTRTPRPWRCTALALLAAAGLAGIAAGRPASNVCLTLGLESAAVRSSEGVIGEVAQQEGIPVCEVSTREGKAYAAVYPAREEHALQSSWEFGIVFKKQPLSALGNGATFFYTPGYHQQALGFSVASHYVWITTGGAHMRAELVALAGVIDARLR